MEALKLIALDKDDIEVVSTHLQDAVVKVSDVYWRPHEHRLVLALDRFDWVAASAASDATPELRRRRAALRFERVAACKCRNVNQGDRDASLNLLAIEFSEEDAPAGIVTMIFSGGAVMRLEVECLEAELVDLGPTWACSECPEHFAETRKLA
jgi:hypothetical protein